jgi:hypothetical protein
MKRFLAASVAAMALVFCASAPARAGLVPPSQVQWSYNWSPGSLTMPADGGTGGSVSFTNEPTKSATGESDTVATNLRVSSTALPSSPEHISANGGYTLTLVLGTSANGSLMTGSLTFDGHLTGPFSSESSYIKNVFGPNATQSLTLGAYTFTVTLNAYTPPGPPNQLNSGSMSAHVTISELSPAGVPEPSTMLLSGLGFTFLGGAAWRKRRQARG